LWMIRAAPIITTSTCMLPHFRTSTGNGGSRKRWHHSKPGPHLDPTRLPLADISETVLIGDSSRSEKFSSAGLEKVNMTEVARAKRQRVALLTPPSDSVSLVELSTFEYRT